MKLRSDVPGPILTIVSQDGLLADIIDRIPSPSYTLLYVTSPKEFDDSGSGFAGYDFENNDIYQEPLHMQLKRDYSAHVSGKESASNSSVFAKYQFFTPGRSSRER